MAHETVELQNIITTVAKQRLPRENCYYGYDTGIHTIFTLAMHFKYFNTYRDMHYKMNTS